MSRFSHLRSRPTLRNQSALTGRFTRRPFTHLTYLTSHPFDRLPYFKEQPTVIPHLSWFVTVMVTLIAFSL